MKQCKACREEINPLRVAALPQTHFCINCAQGIVKPKMGVPVLVGGDIEHGATTLQLIEDDSYQGESYSRDILDVEPEAFAKDPRIPLSIPKRKDLEEVD